MYWFNFNFFKEEYDFDAELIVQQGSVQQQSMQQQSAQQWSLQQYWNLWLDPFLDEISLGPKVLKLAIMDSLDIQYVYADHACFSLYLMLYATLTHHCFCDVMVRQGLCLASDLSW